MDEHNFDFIFEVPFDEGYEAKRVRSRKFGRLPFDCYHAKVLSGGNRVKCDMGHILSKPEDGTVLITMVIQGFRLYACQACIDYDDGGSPGG